MSQINLKPLLTLFFLSILPPPVFAGETTVCTPEMARQAESVAANLKNWNEVYSAYTKFLVCDDGAIGEGFSDSVGRLLAKNWVAVTKLIDLEKRDADFKKFVLKHIDETLSEETLQIIKENAQNRCPVQQIDFCRQIEHSASFPH